MPVPPGAGEIRGGRGGAAPAQQNDAGFQTFLFEQIAKHITEQVTEQQTPIAQYEAIIILTAGELLRQLPAARNSIPVWIPVTPYPVQIVTTTRNLPPGVTAYINPRTGLPVYLYQGRFISPANALYPPQVSTYQGPPTFHLYQMSQVDNPLIAIANQFGRFLQVGAFGALSGPEQTVGGGVASLGIAAFAGFRTGGGPGALIGPAAYVFNQVRFAVAANLAGPQNLPPDLNAVISIVRGNQLVHLDC